MAQKSLNGQTQNEASRGEIVGQAPRRKVYASIEGVLRRLSVAGKDGYTAAIKRIGLLVPTSSFLLPTNIWVSSSKLLSKDKTVTAEGVLVYAGDLPLASMRCPSSKSACATRRFVLSWVPCPRCPKGELAKNFLEAERCQHCQLTRDSSIVSAGVYLACDRTSERGSAQAS